MVRKSEQAPKKSSAKKYCFVVEGQSEEFYLKHTLNLPHIFNPTGQDLGSLYIEATKRLDPKPELDQKTPYERCYIVHDLDALSPNDHHIPKCDKNENIHNIFSAPNFEYAVLLHFENKHPQTVKKDHKVLKEKRYSTEDQPCQDFMKKLNNQVCLDNAYKHSKARDQLLGLHEKSSLKDRVAADKPHSNIYILHDLKPPSFG
jgi:hypothetical protein